MTSDEKKYENYDIGEYTYGSPNIIDRKEANLRIGKFCAISANVNIFLGSEHKTDSVSTYPFKLLDRNVPQSHLSTKGDVIIGNDVWIAFGVTILSGVKIGDGAVIGANSLVTKDMPPYSICGGNPCNVIRYRFSEEIIEQLLIIKWWNWDRAKIIDNVKYLNGPDVLEFIRLYSEK